MKMPSGFNEVRNRVIECLTEQNFDHEPRMDMVEKNLLFAGKVSPESVIEMVLYSKGTDHLTRLHDFDQKILVHIIKPKGKYDGWYIKFFFVPNGTMFISVHN